MEINYEDETATPSPDLGYETFYHSVQAIIPPETDTALNRAEEKKVWKFYFQTFFNSERGI